MTNENLGFTQSITREKQEELFDYINNFFEKNNCSPIQEVHILSSLLLSLCLSLEMDAIAFNGCLEILKTAFQKCLQQEGE